jgi:steroid delta-isomerase
MLSPQTDPRTAQVVQFFETLSPDSVRLLPSIYAEQARFKDPFNEVTGVAGIHRVFTHMFETTNTPRFIVRSAMTQGDEAWLTWDFLIKRQQGELIIHGASHLHYAPDGRIQQHRDYWDPAEELYAHIPVLGTLVRWLTRRLSATA